MSGTAGTRAGPATATARAVARERFDASIAAPVEFFDARAADLARACLELAGAFHAGKRLLVAGTGAAASDALHVSVEFVHPVIVGKRALPAIALTDAPAERVRALAEPGDVVLGIAAGADSGADGRAVREALVAARARGAATIAMVGPDPAGWEADHVFAVASGDPLVVQEVHETAYHVLWELVHVFLDHPEMLE